MIVRTSGPASIATARRLCGPAFTPAAATACLHRLVFRRLSVPAWIYTFIAPHSYTGEDIVEYHLPGNLLLCRMLLDEMLAATGDSPIRLAEAGEFTTRAHFNGKLPLDACEGVAAAIHASNQLELTAARRLLAGELADRLAPLRESLADTVALIEAAIDFSDEGISFIQQSALYERLVLAASSLRQLLADSPRLARLAHEPSVLLVGRPNAGKSTLLNALCQTDRAVVSPEAGTTRDVIWATATLRRGIVHIADAAGLEEAAFFGDAVDPQSQIARQMQSHALRAARRADVLVLVRDIGDPQPPIDLPRPPDLVVRSKIDQSPDFVARESEMLVSALSGRGMPALRESLDAACFGATATAESVALTARHIAAIESALAALGRAIDQLSAAPELLALELREALSATGQILGELTPDDLLGRIFSTFCIGK